MKPRDIFHEATRFGTFHSPSNFFVFGLHCIFYIFPAIILGNYTDVMIQRIKMENELGDHLLNYILLQMLVNISTLYLIILFLAKYTSEFQVTIPGSLFGVLYFGMQPKFLDMLKEYVNK